MSQHPNDPGHDESGDDEAPRPRAAKSQFSKRKVTTNRLKEMKEAGVPIAALTAYDYSMAELVDAAGIDVILVGDSVSTVMQGLETTVTVTMDHMVYHTMLVRRGVERALVVADLPFMSYQVNSDEALRNAGRMVKEAGAEAVKLEGGRVVADTVRRIVDVGIPVMGHLGLTPQSIHKFGTYQVRAQEEEEAAELRRDAKLLEEAGVFSIVLEKVPAELAAEVTASVSVPVIGIGAGGSCDGQILVTHDMLGICTRFNPRFVRRYANIGDDMQKAFEHFAQDVRSRGFPNESESY